jgi:hypothetical protein
MTSRSRRITASDRREIRTIVDRIVGLYTKLGEAKVVVRELNGAIQSDSDRLDELLHHQGEEEDGKS